MKRITTFVLLAGILGMLTFTVSPIRPKVFHKTRTPSSIGSELLANCVARLHHYLNQYNIDITPRIAAKVEKAIVDGLDEQEKRIIRFAQRRYRHDRQTREIAQKILLSSDTGEDVIFDGFIYSVLRVKFSQDRAEIIVPELGFLKTELGKQKDGLDLNFSRYFFGILLGAQTLKYNYPHLTRVRIKPIDVKNPYLASMLYLHGFSLNGAEKSFLNEGHSPIHFFKSYFNLSQPKIPIQVNGEEMMLENLMQLDPYYRSIFDTTQGRLDFEKTYPL